MPEYLMNQCKEGKYKAIFINEYGFVFINDKDTLHIAKKFFKHTIKDLTDSTEGKA